MKMSSLKLEAQDYNITDVTHSPSKVGTILHFMEANLVQGTGIQVYNVSIVRHPLG